MDIIEHVSKLLNLSREDTLQNSKIVDENLTYYWNPARGGASVIVDKDGNYLAATSSIDFDKLLVMFKSGEKNKNFFKEN